MLALSKLFQYSSEQAKVTKTNKTPKKFKKIFYFVVASAIRYPPQQEETRFMRVFSYVLGCMKLIFISFE